MTQCFDDSTLAVSKACCPVCWELLKILRNAASTNFHVDGYHKTLCQVELPEWLPLDVVVELTARFEKILLGQIQRMVKRHTSHQIHPSDQSTDCLSSHSEDGEYDADDTLDHDCRNIPSEDLPF
jgi:hypothetical protein